MQKDSKNLGSFGEDFVAQWLYDNGFSVKEKNYRKRYGEIDLIASKGEVIAFIEVKTRKNSYFNLSEVITYSKQKKIILAAKAYIAKNQFKYKIFRFDVALVEKKGDKFEVQYIPNAFTQSYY